MKTLFLFFLLFGVTIEYNENEIENYYRISQAMFSGMLCKVYLSTLEENTLISPFSLQSVLYLALLGANGKVAGDLSRTLHLPNVAEIVNAFHTHIASHLIYQHKYTFNILNRIYMDVNMPSASNRYKKKLYELHADFRYINHFSKLPSEINNWVAKFTNDSINSAAYNLDLAFSNVAYFLAEWKHPFQIESGTFLSPKYLPKTVEMLTVTEKFYIADIPNMDMQMLQIPFIADDITLMILLPNNASHFTFAEMSAYVYEKVFNAFIYRQVSVRVCIPANFAKKSHVTNFTPVLKKMGLYNIINDYANFSDFIKNPIKFEKIVQATSVNINRNGGSFSAGTVNTARKMQRRYSDSVEVFNANRPFMYFFKHKKLGVLFVGKYVKA